MSEPIATYSPALLTDLDWMRHALGDTNTAAPFAPDVTFLAYLDTAGNIWRLAAAALARSLASRAINQPTSIPVGGGSLSWSDRAAQWLKIAATLEAEASRLGIGSGGGLWVAEVERSDMVSDDGEYSIELRR